MFLRKCNDDVQNRENTGWGQHPSKQELSWCHIIDVWESSGLTLWFIWFWGHSYFDVNVNSTAVVAFSLRQHGVNFRSRFCLTDFYSISHPLWLHSWLYLVPLMMSLAKHYLPLSLPHPLPLEDLVLLVRPSVFWASDGEQYWNGYRKQYGEYKSHSLYLHLRVFCCCLGIGWAIFGQQKRLFFKSSSVSQSHTTVEFESDFLIFLLLISGRNRL